MTSTEPIADTPQPGIDRVRLAWAVAAGCAVFLLPLVAAVGLLGPQTAQAAVGDGGGVVEMPGSPAPDFTLTDQDGRPLAMRDLQLVMPSRTDAVVLERVRQAATPSRSLVARR